MGKRLNLEKKLDYGLFSAKLGTSNRYDPESFYVTGKAYITPKSDNEDMKTNLSLAEIDMRHKIGYFARTNGFTNKDYIFNFEVSENGLKMGKNSYIFFQLFLTQNKVSTLNDIKTEFSDILKPVVYGIRESLVTHGFKIKDRKR